MNMNREDVVQAALTLERWCKEHYVSGKVCDCPFILNTHCVSYPDCKVAVHP